MVLEAERLEKYNLKTLKKTKKEEMKGSLDEDDGNFCL